ncbi:MAG TPA: hypothetical protein VL485_13000 [Ktedonobacteraceae bacterium]|jgi:hypothetical protein|nr:hypothetical protein [Ktedonobacteraceae bacterium]
MVIRYTQWVLRVAAILALILGLLTWFGIDTVVGIHMILGIIVVLSLWVLGGMAFTVKGGVPLGIIAIIWGLIVLALGMTQKTILPSDSIHWIIQIVHLLVGLAAIGLGEAIGGRYKRQSAAATMQV